MFKKKQQKTNAPQPAPAPATDPVLEQTNREIARLERIKRMGEEAEMWRKFAEGCKPLRGLRENYSPMIWLDRDMPQPLFVVMDEDSAPLWRRFALEMADERQRRLRDLLAA